MSALRVRLAAGASVGLVVLAMATSAGGQSCRSSIPEPSALDLRPAAPPLLVSRAGALVLHLAWEDTAARYVPSRGTLASLWSRRAYDHAPLDCDLAAPLLDVADDAGDVYFVVAGRSDTELSSSGRDSFARERPGPDPGCPPFWGCGASSASALPGACIEFSSAESAFTLAEAAAGIAIPYDLIVEDSIPGVTPLEHDCDCCGDGGETTTGCGLIVLEMLSGLGQVSGPCDGGIDCKCVPVTVTVGQGRYDQSFTWDGRNGCMPGSRGAPFPPGTYTFEVSSVGYWDTPSGVMPFRVAGTHRVTLVP